MSNTFIPALKYNFLTPAYDLIIKLLVPERRIKNDVIKWSNANKNSKIIDFGSGTGTLLIALHKLNESVIGVDIDPAMHAIAEKKLKNAGIKPNLLYNTKKITTASIDNVFSTWVFHHLSINDKTMVINELFRILKKDGEMMILDWGIPQNKRMKIMFFILQLIDNFETTNDNKTGKLLDYFHNAGFEKISKLKNYQTFLGTASLWKIQK